MKPVTDYPLAIDMRVKNNDHGDEVEDDDAKEDYF